MQVVSSEIFWCQISKLNKQKLDSDKNCKSSTCFPAFCMENGWSQEEEENSQMVPTLSAIC